MTTAPTSGDAPISIKRYPNRRFYAKHESKYISLQEIEALIRSGATVEIRDSQTDEDITRIVLTQMLLDRQPDKIALFPTDMLHFMLRSNDLMVEFLRDYFRHSLTYLDYLQKHNVAAQNLTKPIHWVKAWLDGFGPRDRANGTKPKESPTAAPESPETSRSQEGDDPKLAARIAQLEDRIRQLESRQD